MRTKAPCSGAATVEHPRQRAPGAAPYLGLAMLSMGHAGKQTQSRAGTCRRVQECAGTCKSRAPLLPRPHSGDRIQKAASPLSASPLRESFCSPNRLPGANGVLAPPLSCCATDTSKRCFGRAIENGIVNEHGVGRALQARPRDARARRITARHARALHGLGQGAQ